MWPNLKPLGAKIDKIIEKNDNNGIKIRAIKIRVSGDIDGDIKVKLIESGFTYNDKWSGYVRDGSSFKLSELKNWFPQFDPETMIDNEVPRLLEMTEIMPGINVTSFNIGGYSLQNNVKSSLQPEELRSLLGVPAPVLVQDNTKKPEEILPAGEQVNQQVANSDVNFNNQNDDAKQVSQVKTGDSTLFTMPQRVGDSAPASISPSKNTNNAVLQGSLFDAQEYLADSLGDEGLEDSDDEEYEDSDGDDLDKKKRIEDAGEKIGGAIKDRFAGRSITVSDLSDMTEDEKKKNIKKTLIWPYSYKKAKENGVSAAVAHFIHNLRLSLPEYGIVSDLREIEYVGMMNAIAENLNESVITGDDLVKSLNNLVNDQRVIDGVKIMNDSTYHVRIDGKVCYSSKRMSMTKWFLSIKPQNKDQVYRYDSALDFDCAGTDERKERCQRYIDRFWASKIKGVRDKEGKPVTPERPHLENLINKWLDDKDVDADQLIKTFGFRGVEFGNWLPQDERQFVLNEAYASAKALSAVLAIPEKHISLGGELAIAFGSRGRGGRGSALAHYEPSFRVFNLTRKKGAGSMAHEYGHALDDFLLKIIRDRVSNLPPDLNASIPSSSNALFFVGNDATRIQNYLSNIERYGVEKHEIDGLIIDLIDKCDSLVDTFYEKRNDPAEDMKERLINVVSGVFSADTYLREYKNREQDKMLMPTRIKVMLDSIIQESWGIDSKDGCDLNKLSEIINSEDNVGNIKVKVALMVGEKLAEKRTKENYVPQKRPYDNSDTERIVERIKAFAENVGSFDTQTKKGVKHNINYSMHHLAAFNAIVIDPKITRKHSTNFAKDAALLDKGKPKSYWASKHEMFARAFECYVFDQLEQQDQKCDYLVHSVEAKLYDKANFVGNPYPKDDERVAINAVMDEFVQSAANVIRCYEKYRSDMQNNDKKHLKNAM